jgi:hypothetical protein
MRKSTSGHTYKPTEAHYKGNAREMYVTYDLPQQTRGENEALYPKVKRVYIAGNVKDWHLGTFEKRTGKKVHGMKIDYEQSRSGYERRGYTAKRGETTYEVSPARVGKGTSHFTKIVEVPEDARNVQFHRSELPARYKDALQRVR